jgi:tetratricopeptide (TPR) repeat protein
VLLVLGLVAAVAWRLLRAEHEFRAAGRALARRDYASARSHLDHYLSVWPRSRAARLLLVRCASASGDFDEAERQLAECKRLGAEREAVAFEQYLLDAHRGTLSPAAAEVLRGWVETDHPEAERIVEAMTEGYLYTNRRREALGCLERWLARAPGDAQALYLRGQVWEGTGAHPQAIDDYRAALRRDPDHAGARKRLAEQLLARGEVAEAGRLFAGLLENAPDDPALLLGLARCRRLQARLGEAERLLDEAAARAAPLPATLVERARLAQQKGDAAGAERWYRRALERDPSEREAWYGLAQCLRQQGRDLEARCHEGRAAGLERDEYRLDELSRQSDKDLRDPGPPCEAGLICLRNGHKAEAVRWFRNALQRNPDHAASRRGLEQALAK